MHPAHQPYEVVGWHTTYGDEEFSQYWLLPYEGGYKNQLISEFGENPDELRGIIRNTVPEIILVDRLQDFINSQPDMTNYSSGWERPIP